MTATRPGGFRLCFLSLMALFGLLLPVSAATLTVPGQYATIQAAIDAAHNRDIVQVSDGVYTGRGNVDLDFGDKNNLTVTSVNGPSATIINCGGSRSANHRGFLFQNGEFHAVIHGLTIKNGYENENGGGIEIENRSAVTLNNCIITSNAADEGGGIYNNQFSTLTLTNCQVTNNTTINNGGGLYNNSGTLTMTDCMISGNNASFASGIQNYNFEGRSVNLTNCAIIDNSATHEGGGVDNDGMMTLTNCTITGNTASTSGGVFNFLGTLTLMNDIIYGNDEGTGGDMIVSQGEVNAAYCDIQQTSGVYAGTGNLNADPLFVSGSPPYDLRLRPGSPGIGAGTSSGAPLTDIENKPRRNPPTVGAYEYVPVSITVSVGSLSSTVGQTVTLTGMLTKTGGGAGVSNKTLTFKVGGATVGAGVTNTLGVATVSYHISSLSRGSHAITVSFAGDSGYSASSGTGTLTVN